MPVPVDIKKGNVSFSSNITGKVDKGLKVVSNLSLNDLNFIEKNINQLVRIGNLQVNLLLDSNKYMADVLCSDLNTKINNNPISLERFKFAFDEKKITIPENIIKLANSDVKISKKNGIMELLSTHPDSLKRVKRLGELEY